MFEFALLFGILAFVNFETVPSQAAQALGPGYIAAFIAILLLAPLIFAYTTLLSDELTAALGLDYSSSRDIFHRGPRADNDRLENKPQTSNDIPKKNIWLRSSIAVVIGLAIGIVMVLLALAGFTKKLDY